MPVLAAVGTTHTHTHIICYQAVAGLYLPPHLLCGISRAVLVAVWWAVSVSLSAQLQCPS